MLSLSTSSDVHMKGHPESLTHLNTLAAALADELKLIPSISDTSLQIPASGKDASALALKQLQDEIDLYWSTPNAQGTPRREVFISGLEQALRNEVQLKIHDKTLHPSYVACLPQQDDNRSEPAPDFYTLHLQLNERISVEIAGALVITVGQGHTLLSVPGYGTEGFASQTEMRESITRWVNDKTLRGELLNNAWQHYQDVLADIENDADLFLDEPFTSSSWQLHPVMDEPFEHAFARQLNKQREDISYAFNDGRQRSADQVQWSLQIHRAVSMPGLLGPESMLIRRAFEHRENKQRQQLPEWFKNATLTECQDYVRGLQTYEHSRIALLSMLGGASSPEQFANERLRARIGNDLGYDLNPEHLIVSTWRNLPLTGEPYKLTRPLNQMALYGLHPGDMEAGSIFLTWSTVTLQGQPLGSTYPGLTNAYIGGLIQELDLRTAFGPVQREAYGSPNVQRLMCDVTRHQVKAMAYAAKLRGHILPGDFDLIEAANQLASNSSEGTLSVQQVKLNNRDTLSNMLLFRKQDAQGQLDRLVLFMIDNPRDRQFQGFDNETQLRHELVGWSAFPEMRSYLLKQVKVASRVALEKQLIGLNEKPQPPTDFMTLETSQSYDEGLRALVVEHIRVALTDQNQHSPDWYLRASTIQRQELVALEDAISAARENYEAKAHAQVQSFDAYVHQRAMQKINTLLGTAEGTVDPDRIIITSGRETLSYTQMLRNGYDDSINPISTNPIAEARFSGPAGIDLTPLTSEKVARSVHGAWLSDNYVTLIKNTLLNANSTGYTYRRRASLLITQLQMSAAALRSHLKNEIDTQQYQWLKASIEQMHQSDSTIRGSYRLYPLEFKLDNPLIATNVPALGSALEPLLFSNTQIETVLGCHVLTPDGGDARSALLYTPNAPDGLVFRPFNTFVDTLKREGMSDYYKDRCRISANRKLAFFLADMKAEGKSKPPVLPATPLADLYDTCFNQVIERKIRDVEDTTTGRSDMIVKMVWTSIELIATALTLPFPPASFAVGALLSFRDSLHALEAFSEGDREAASGYILSSLFNGLGAAGDFHSGLKGFSGVLRQLTRNAGKNQTIQTAKQLQHISPPLKDLSPIQVHGEQFWTGKPTLKGHAPLFRANPQEPEKLIPTGQFAEKDSAGLWQPLRRDSDQSQPAPQGKVNTAYAVNISLQETTPITTGHAKGVTLLRGQHYIELEGLTFMVWFDPKMRCWMLIDHNNPFAFFGKQPVRLDEKGQWHVLDALNLRGGGRSEFHALQEEAAGPSTAVSDLSDYELPANLQRYMHGIVNPAVAQDMAISGLVVEEWLANLYTDLRKTYTTLRENLYRDASAFFENPTLVARPPIPLLDASASPETLVNSIFEKTNGLVISEAPKSVASKQWLIDNMSLLVEQKVEILYIEHLLTDQHARKLAKYKKLGSKTRSGSHEIKNHLEEVNAGALDNQSKDYDYYHLVKAAHRNGIEIKPLNSSVSYPFNNNPVATAEGDTVAAQKMSNFIGRKVIAADTEAMPQRRWIALLDHKTATTWQRVPGITELQGAISVRIEDVAAGRSTRVSRDIGGSIADDPTAKADFKLEIANPQIVEAPSSSVTTSTTDRLDNALYLQLEGRSIFQWSLDPSTGNLVAKRSDVVNPYTGEHGFQLDEAGRWQRVDPAAWQADTSLSPIQNSLLDADYDVPVELREAVHKLANFKRRGLSEIYLIEEPSLAPAREAFFELRRKLQDDAKSIISVELPPRPALPAIEPAAPLTHVLDSLYEHAPGVVIGESHFSIASKKFIIDNMEHLSGQQVKTLYMEHLLTDLHQADLDRFNDTGKMTKKLLHDLKRLDTGHHTDPNKVYTFEQLVIKAQAHGVEVRAIDCAASYHVKGMSTGAPTTRQQMMSYFASRTIRRHQEVMGSHKWIALVGNTHSNTYKNLVPGLAELEGGIGVRLIDTQPGQGRGFMLDPGEQVMDKLGAEHTFLKNDYRLEMDTLESTTVSPGPSSDIAGRPQLALPVESTALQERLSQPGMFLIEGSEPAQRVIVHRSRNNTLQRTPILLNAEGKLYVDRESWELIHLQPHDDLPALIQALEEFNLTHVG